MAKMVKVNKLEASLSQLITAIELYVGNKDEVSIYTLARASEEILDRICKNRGIERGAMYEGIESLNLTDESKKKIVKRLNEPRNFFKHAEDDHDAVLEWGVGVIEHYLRDCVTMYKRITGEILTPCELTAFSVIHRVRNPDMYEEKGDELFQINLEEIKTLLDRKGKEFVYRSLVEVCEANKSVA